jgi:hypothetical protein
LALVNLFFVLFEAKQSLFYALYAENALYVLSRPAHHHENEGGGELIRRQELTRI